MNTDDLITRLAKDVPPVRRGATVMRLALGILLGALVSATVVVLALGIRPDLGLAMRGTAFWIKWGYTFSLALAAIVMTVQLARPDSARLRWTWLLAVPVVLLTGLGVAELARTPPALWLAMWLGHSWMICPWLVLALAWPCRSSSGCSGRSAAWRRRGCARRAPQPDWRRAPLRRLSIASIAPRFRRSSC
jgi:hypothetical protein